MISSYLTSPQLISLHLHHAELTSPINHIAVCGNTEYVQNSGHSLSLGLTLT